MGRDGAHTDTILVGRVEEAAALEDLEVPELTDDDEEPERGDGGDRDDATLAGIPSPRRRPEVRVEAAPLVHEARSLRTLLHASANTSAAPRNPL